MQKLVYLYELDSVRKTDSEIAIGQQALYDEIVENGNTVVLTYNQLVDSRGFFSLLDVKGYYDNLVHLFENGAVRISQYGDIRTISQYLIQSLSQDRSFIYSGWPLKSTQKRLLALIKRSLIYSDLTEINDYLSGVRNDEEMLDLFIEVDTSRSQIPTLLSVKQCKDILENLFFLLKTVLRLSSINTIYVNPKPADEYKMSLPKYLHHALSLTPTTNTDLWSEAKQILLSLKYEFEGITQRNEPVFDYERIKGSFDRSDYHHAIRKLYQNSAGKDLNITGYQYAEAIVDLCYNYQMEYSVCNSSKHYNISEFNSAEPSEWITFASDFFSRLAQTWDIGDHNNRYLLAETNVFHEYEAGKEFPDFSRAVRMLKYTEKEIASNNSEDIPRYEYHFANQKKMRRKEILTSIRKKVLFSFVCFGIALTFEVLCGYLQNFVDSLLKRWINVNSLVWTTLCIAFETLLILGITEFITGKIAKRYPEFLQLSDALREIGLLSKDRKATKSMYKKGCSTYCNPDESNIELKEHFRKGLNIDFIKTDAIKQYMYMQKNQTSFFGKSDVYPIADLSDNNTELNTVLKKLFRLEELFGYHFGVVYKSKYNTMVVDPIEVNGNVNSSCLIKPYYPYERVVPTSDKDGVVMIPRHQDKFILIKQYRHAIRAEQYSFPRGYAENGGTPEENAVRELKEELNAAGIIRVKFLDRVAADSGLTSTKAYVFLADIEKFTPQTGHEGIIDIVALTMEEVDRWISNGKINDGFTLSAWTMFKNMSKEVP